ncbi:MAG: 2-dehydropantoate 2-reductase [Candidatus Omnitrophica bacterium]|nr:2-dehydropantoate 2-reductase [Candidatus Omnitrophota bacterium]
MKIAVIGAGAIGSVVAAYLSKAGLDVMLIGKKDQVDTINKNGLRIQGVRGKEVFKIKALTQLGERCDLAIFVTKTQDLEQAYRHNCKFLEGSLILTTQNGVQADNILSKYFDQEKMFSSIVMFGATYTKPGEVIFNFEGDWIIGRPCLSTDDKTKEIAGLLEKAFKIVLSENIMGMKWLKLFVNFNNCICAILGKPMQATFADLDFCRLSVLLLKEGVAVTQSAKIELVSLPQFPAERIHGLAHMPMEQAVGIIHKTLTTLSKEPLYGSILQSIMRKRASEIDFINGEIVSLGKKIHHPVPLNEKIVELVHRVEITGKFLTEAKKELKLI